MTHMMRAGTAVRVGKYRSHDAVASCEDFDARGGHSSLTLQGRALLQTCVVECPRRSDATTVAFS